MNRHHLIRVAAALVLTAGVVCPVTVEAQEENEEAPDTALVLVVGEVVDDDTGRPVQGARVTLEGHGSGTQTQGTQTTDRDGEFRFRDVPEGRYGLVVRAEGYDQMLDSLPVRDGYRLHFTLPLSKGRGSLEPQAVTDDPGREGARDYRGRSRRGGSGFLVTREDILEEQPRTVSEMLSRVPGGMLVPSSTGGYTLLLREQCQPGLWMDGVRLGVSNIDMLVRPQEVEALEVYHGFELPVEFGVNPCGGILVWTRRGLEVPPPDDEEGEEGEEGESKGRRILGHLLQAAVLVVAILTLGT